MADRPREDQDHDTADRRVREGDPPPRPAPADPRGELRLENGDAALPWLESADYAEPAGTDTGRIVGFIILALLALAIIVGAIWYFTRPAMDAELAGDGSTIAAPEGPVKEAPANPGGKDFAREGDVAPAVGQGETREGRLAEKTERADAPRDAAADESVEVSTPAARSGSGVPVQVGAYSTHALAERGWQQVNRQTDALSGVRYRIVQATVDNSIVFRLQAMAGNRGAANTLCRNLKADGVACQVK